MNARVLFVDDDENILAAFRRQFRKAFDIATASSGAAGLDILVQTPPFAVVVADMRMPGMDGVQFLARVKDIAPHTSRIMLTGHAEIGTAIDAVNNGKIFRFLTKPCSSEDLSQAVESGIRQNHLITAEQELLEKTLSQSVQLLSEVFSLSSPTAYSRTLRINTTVQQIVSRMGLENVWQYKLAAMLSQIGCVAISPQVLEKVATGRPLTREEENTFGSHPIIGSRLIRSIPRLEVVAAMVAGQLKHFDEYELIAWSKEEQEANLGAQILKAAQDYDQLTQTNLSHSEAVNVLEGRSGWYNPAVIKAIRKEKLQVNSLIFKLVNVKALDVGMILDEDVYSKDGKLLGARHDKITQWLLDLFQLEGENRGVIEPFRVYAQPELLLNE